MKGFWFCAAYVMLLIVLQEVMAQDVDSSAQPGTTGVDVATFKPPKSKIMKPPSYPRRNQVQGKEGWVFMTYMIDRRGVSL